MRRRARLEIGFVHQAAGEILAHDQIVDVGDEFLDAGIGVIQIGDDGNVRQHAPSGGLRGRGGVVAIDVQHASIHDPFAAKIGGLKNHLFVALTDDRALAGSIDEDDVVQARAPGTVTIRASAPDAAEGVLVQARRIVVAELAHVAGAQAPGLAGDDGGRHLAAGLRGSIGVVDLGAGLREIARAESECPWRSGRRRRHRRAQ